MVEEIDNYDLGSQENIEEDFLIKEDAKEVIDIVNRLNANVQQIFRLKVFADMTVKDIGKVLDISESTVKTRFYNTVKKIKKVLEEGENETR